MSLLPRYRPALRAPLPSILHHKSFSTTPTPHFLETVISSAHTVLETTHTFSHTPWVLTLPLVALSLRAFILLPLSVYVRKATVQQYQLYPLLNGWAQQIRVQQMKTKRHLGPAVVERDTAQAIRVKRRELYKRWNCGYWKSYLPLTQLVVWLPIMEAIREKAGARSGILGLFTGEKEVPETISISSEMQSTLQPDIPISSETITQLKNIDPSFATEGALWFPDLSVADPMLILPFLLSASMFLNIYVSRTRRVPGSTISTSRRRLDTTLGIIALAVGPLTLQIPAGMLVYWISSMNIGIVQNLIMERWMPLKPPVTPCGLNIKKAVPVKK